MVANDDFLYVINGLRKLSSASASKTCPRPRPRPQRFVLGLGLGLENLSSFNITDLFDILPAISSEKVKKK